MAINHGNAVRLKNIFLLLALYASLPLFLMSTNPERLPLPLLLVPFLLLFLVIFLTVLLIGKRTPILKGMQRRRQYAVAALIAAIPMLLAVFQSLHQLNGRDILIAIGLAAAVSFYIARADFLR